LGAFQHNESHEREALVPAWVEEVTAKELNVCWASKTGDQQRQVTGPTDIVPAGAHLWSEQCFP